MSVPTRGRRNPTDVPSLAGKPWNLVAGPVERAIRALAALYDGLPSPHEDTHLQGGSDALQAPDTPEGLVLNGTADAGVGPSYALEDHVHALDLLLTTKGDLLAHTGSIYVRLGVGANDQVLIADSTQATGWRWGAVPVTPATVVTPAQITSNQNDYSAATGTINRMSTDASRDVTGFVAAANGTQRRWVNVGAFDLVLKHQNAGSAAANRLLCQGAADITLAPDFNAFGWYDGTTQRWRVHAE